MAMDIDEWAFEEWICQQKLPMWDDFSAQLWQLRKRNQRKEVFSLETKNDFSDFRTQEMAAAISILCIHIQQKGTMTKDELLKKDDAKETI